MQLRNLGRSGLRVSVIGLGCNNFGGRIDLEASRRVVDRAIDRGIGLGYIEGQLRDRFGATQPRAVATVIRAARAPVTIEDLRLGLDSIAPDLVSGGHEALWAGLRNAISNLVVLHKEGSPSPRPSARMARARRLLEAGQVEAALAEIERFTGERLALDYGDWRQGDQLYFVADTTKLETALGWRPRLGWRDGVRDLARWLGERRAAAPQRRRMHA